MKTGMAHLPLHGGKAPSWLFNRMKNLAREIVLAVIYEYGSREFLERLSDPFWFQAFGCALGFDWHSSGLTTTVCGAVKEGIREMGHEIGFFVAGGKGRVSRKTPTEIMACGNHLAINPEKLVYASKMAAKVDSAAVQDGYQLYHHVFFFDREGRWAVVQQGMNDANCYARRYHWLGIGPVDFTCEPHKAVCCDSHGQVLNLVAEEGEANRLASAQLIAEPPDRLIREVRKIEDLKLPARHHILRTEINPDYLYRILLKTYEARPADFEALLGVHGVGPKTLRSIAFLAELIYGAMPSFRDPARFSYAHGGKDGYPYPLDRENYDYSIYFLREIVNISKIGESDKKEVFRRLATFYDQVRAT